MSIYFNYEMPIIIDSRSRTPLYEQIIERVKNIVLEGLLKADDQIPSIRQLTQQLGINPNTIQKAYAELERQGVIYTIPGKGAYISPDTKKLTSVKCIEILNELENLIKDAKKYDIKKDAVYEIINIVYGNLDYIKY